MRSQDKQESGPGLDRRGLMDRIPAYGVWLAAVPPLVFAAAVLLAGLWTGLSCNPLYHAAPTTPARAAELGKSDWADALADIDRRSSAYSQARARGAMLHVCP
jgi:uncharacterized RDD family membrane protein YckC